MTDDGTNGEKRGNERKSEKRYEVAREVSWLKVKVEDPKKNEKWKITFFFVFATSL